MAGATTIVTLALDPASAARFEALRQAHYPVHLNHIPAHLTLFHQLPESGAVADALAAEAKATAAFSIAPTGVRSLGRGVAFRLASEPLQALHRRLAQRFHDHLTPQDRQRFSPHIVVQNKVGPQQAKALLAVLQAQALPPALNAEGLLWWQYLGGPWRHLATFPFATTPE